MFTNLVKVLFTQYHKTFQLLGLVSEVAEDASPAVEQALDRSTEVLAVAAEDIGKILIDAQEEVKGTLTEDRLKRIQTLMAELVAVVEEQPKRAEATANGIKLRFKRVKKNIQEYREAKKACPDSEEC